MMTGEYTSTDAAAHRVSRVAMAVRRSSGGVSAVYSWTGTRSAYRAATLTAWALVMQGTTTFRPASTAASRAASQVPTSAWG